MVAVLIMSTDNEPSVSNVKAMQETFVKHYNENKSNYKNNYVFYEYRAFKEERSEDSRLFIPEKTEVENYNILHINLKESIFNTFEKTVDALSYIISNYTFSSVVGSAIEWIVRINISSYLNLQLLDSILEFLDKDICYCSALNTYTNDDAYLNDIYPRGDFLLFSTEFYHKISPEFRKYYYNNTIEKDKCLALHVPHVDDCLFGLTIIDHFGKKYTDHLKMLKYNFLPATNNINGFNKLAISSRVKTVPPDETYSGYSWDDNIYRRCDGIKMRAIYKIVSDTSYKDIDEFTFKNLILENEDTCRQVPIVLHKACSITNIKKYIEQKRGT